MIMKITARDLLLLLVLTAAGVLLHGYHLGHQDGAIYLPAIKKNLNPALYPYDSAFFLSQTRWMLFGELVVFSVRLIQVPLDLAVFLWHLLAIFVVLLASLQMSRRIFVAPTAQWGAVLTVWAARLLPVAGTQLQLMDRYLHPRDLATAALLLAFVAILDGSLAALGWIAAAAVIHPTMALFGAFHLAIQRFGAWKLLAMAPLIPLFAFGAPRGPVANDAWREVLSTRPYLFPLRWHWYEWLGVIAPLAILTWFARFGRTGAPACSLVNQVSRRAVLAGVLGVAGAILITTVPAFERFIPTEPMRTLYFVYFLLVFLGGGLLGERVLRNHPVRWLLFLAPLCLVFFFSHRLSYPSSPHIEWPGRVPKNAWVEAFDWIRRNTPQEALCALDPLHMARPGEDSHGFRAFAERSMLADWVKDRAVSALAPELAPTWREQVRDLGISEIRAGATLDRWRDFGPDDFRRLQKKYGVSWVVLERPTEAGAALASRRDPRELPCPYANSVVMVCRVE